jgi:transposase
MLRSTRVRARAWSRIPFQNAVFKLSQDRDGAESLLREARRTFPSVERVIGDAGYQGRKMEAALARTGAWTLQIVRRCDRHRFVVLPKRWIIERTLAWISRNRRLARD